MTAWGETPPLDRERLLAQCGGDRELAAALLDSYRADSGPLFAALDAALAAGDPETVSLHAHSLKGLAAYLCADELRRLAQRIEEEAEAGRMQWLDITAAEARAAHDALIAFLERCTP